ncbi:hypothetical protein WR25_10866 [Diploscapter pachys]|uniref:Uncharacterized protein n=1 Tax=Diploscapter pachys TaxID=2018661 RepID=A0A2A2LZ83_9BILA|nr:hypothetical protein WR25_10866 [Diploscapter pachys]
MSIYFLSSLLLPVASLASDSQSNNKRIARSMLEFDPCLDYQLDSLQRLKFPPKFARLALPWKDLEETPKLDDVIRFLESVNCFFLPFGEVVRNSILRQHPKQTTGEVSCSIQKYLVDVTGHGLTDVCERKIEATVASSDQWKQWADNSTICVGRVSAWTIQTFYCERILKGIIGWAGEDSTTTCHIVFPDNYERHAIAEAKEILTNELGTTWSKKINSMIDEIEAIYVTNSQFVQVRNKYANRTNEANPTSKNTTTRYIGAGPMIQDIGDVHRRPIMWKSEAPTELPSDFPSVSNAKPDTGSDKFEFRSQQSPDISVYENPIAYEQDDWQGGTSSEDRTRKRGTGIGTQKNDHHENIPYTSSSYSTVSCSSLIFSFLGVVFVNIWCL